MTKILVTIGTAILAAAAQFITVQILERALGRAGFYKVANEVNDHRRTNPNSLYI